jgi:hypothetical protein
VFQNPPAPAWRTLPVSGGTTDRQMNRFLILTVCLTIFSCSEPDKIIDLTKEQAFKKFVARQRLVDLPIHFDIDQITDTLTQPAIVDPLDSLFIPTDYAMNRIYGIYKDTNSFFIFITFGTADDYIPNIEIFNKHGDKIQEEDVFVDGCGADCGYYCNAISNIYKDNSTSEIKFYARDSVRYYECDSTGNEVPGTLVHYVKFKSGIVDNSGQITIKTGSTNLLK